MKDLTEQILQDVITTRPQESFKGTFGKVLLVGGNHQFGGAIIMAATAAVNAGAGLVTVACDLVNRTALHARLPEAMVIDFSNQAALLEMLNGVDTIVVGPGLGEEEQSLAVLKTVFANTKPTQTVVIDGSAITLMATHQLAAPAGHLVFTPHQMEWQRLSGIPIKDQAEALNQAAQEKLGGTVVLKRHHTEIYTANGTFRLPIGSAAQAVGGMGDTLAGMIGGFYAQFKEAGDQAVLAAVYAHSAIADQIAKDQYIVLPTQIATALPSFMKKVEQGPATHHIGFLGGELRC
ncbi:MAG: NAD(P)H-hydrate dehydratase [Limosilactobacillus fermentum]|nr:MAG: NAD(P)H-hydrate dehydratase [Limosilactobacillus fermentum]